MSDWRLSGSDIEDLRLVFVEARGTVGVRSPQAGIEAAAMFEAIRRPNELRCGPIYVKTPNGEASGYELTDAHVKGLKRLDRATRIVAALKARSPEALTVLQLCYLTHPAPGLHAWDTEQGDHAARLSNLVAPQRDTPRLPAVARLYALADEPKPPLGRWLMGVSHRVFFGRGTQAGAPAEDVAIVEEIGNEATAVLAAASREWRAARQGVRRG